MGKVSESEIGPCAGVTITEKVAKELGLPVMGEVCNDMMPLRIKGYDGKWRCQKCTKIHNELIFADTKKQGQAPL